MAVLKNLRVQGDCTVCRALMYASVAISEAIEALPQGNTPDEIKRSFSFEKSMRTAQAALNRAMKAQAESSSLLSLREGLFDEAAHSLRS